MQSTDFVGYQHYKNGVLNDILNAFYLTLVNFSWPAKMLRLLNLVVCFYILNKFNFG